VSSAGCISDERVADYLQGFHRAPKPAMAQRRAARSALSDGCGETPHGSIRHGDVCSACAVLEGCGPAPVFQYLMDKIDYPSFCGSVEGCPSAANPHARRPLPTRKLQHRGPIRSRTGSPRSATTARPANPQRIPQLGIRPRRRGITSLRPYDVGMYITNIQLWQSIKNTKESIPLRCNHVRR
jgi:hypothetical protein